jgi:hypothetical protein
MHSAGRMIQVRLGDAESSFRLDTSKVAAIFLPNPTAELEDSHFGYTYSLLFGLWRVPEQPPLEEAEMRQRLAYLKTSKFIKQTRTIEVDQPVTAIVILN